MMPLPESTGLSYDKPAEIKPGEVLNRRIRDMLLVQAMLNVQKIKDKVMEEENG